MMSGDLLVLASKYVALTGEIDDVRRQMLACLTNGAGANPVRPTPAKRPGAKGPQPSNPKAIEAAKAEEAIVDLLRTKPGLKISELIKSSGAKKSTVAERLRRLKTRGQIASDGAGGWTAASPA
jgi:hypothetical protein